MSLRVGRGGDGGKGAWLTGEAGVDNPVCQSPTDSAEGDPLGGDVFMKS